MPNWSSGHIYFQSSNHPVLSGKLKNDGSIWYWRNHWCICFLVIQKCEGLKRGAEQVERENWEFRFFYTNVSPLLMRTNPFLYYKQQLIHKYTSWGTVKVILSTSMGPTISSCIMNIGTFWLKNYSTQGLVIYSWWTEISFHNLSSNSGFIHLSSNSSSFATRRQTLPSLGSMDKSHLIWE